MKITVRLKSRGGLSDLVKKQLPFAMANALNRTAEEFLREMRQEMPAHFIVRVPGFVLPPTQLPREWRANKQNLNVRMGLSEGRANPESIGGRREKIFRKFEEGGRKTAHDPDYPIAIPTSALRPSAQALIPRGLYPKALRLTPRREASGATLPALRKGKVRTLGGASISNKKRRQLGLTGLLGTFTMTGPDGPIGVFQRIGKGQGRASRRMLWQYRRSIPIPRRLRLVETAVRVARERLAINLNGVLRVALKTGR